jgi:hypothetical protein
VANLEKDLAEGILKAGGLSAARLGLRFDRVVGRVLGDLRAFADGAAPEGVTVIVTLTAPIRRPAKTVEVLRQAIGAMLSGDARSVDHRDTVQGNAVRARLVRHPVNQAPKLIGFVHNPGPAADPLLDVAEQWVRR